MQLHMRMNFEFLDAETLERLFQDALRVWRKTVFHIDGTDEFFDYLTAYGCVADGDRVRFPDAVIDKTLARVAEEKRKTVAAAESARPNDPAQWPESQITLYTHGQALHICDTETNAIREARTEDLESWCRLVDGIGIERRTHPTFIPTDAPVGAQDFQAFATIMLNSRRPHRVSVFSAKMLPLFIEAQAIAEGGVEQVRRAPIFATKCWINSPFMITRENVEIALAARRLLGRPIEFGLMPVAGASSPITLAGSLVQNTAESLAVNAMRLAIDNRTHGITPTASLMDMSQSTQRQCGPDFALHQAAGSQMHAYLFGGRPSVSIGTTAVSAQTVSPQSVYEKAMKAGFNIAAGARTFGCGSLAYSDVGSPVQLLIDHEIGVFFQRLFQQVSCDAEHVGLDTILDTVPRGSRYMAAEHTAVFCREEGWFAKYLDHRPPLAWAQDPTDMIARARRDALRRERTAENQCPLSEDQRRAVRDLIAQAHAITGQ